MDEPRHQPDGRAVTDRDQPLPLEHIHELATARLHPAAELGIEQRDCPREIRRGLEPADRQVGNDQIPKP
jgi:hypothetical protein